MTRILAAWRLIDWPLVAAIVKDGIIAAVILTYLAGHALGTAVHSTNDRLAAAAVRWTVPTADRPAPPVAAPEPPPAPPVPAFDPPRLENLTVKELRIITGVKSKRIRKAELVALAYAI